MKSLIKLFLLITTLILPVQNLYAASATVPVNANTSCGLDSSTGDIEDKSAEICQEDIAFNVLYLLFNKVFEQDTIKGVVEEITPVGAGIKTFSAAAGSGDSIMTIFGAVNNIIILFALMFFSYSVIKILYKTQTNGEFLGDRRSKVTGVIFNNMAVIILLAPVGSVLVIQLLVLFLAIIAIMLGNYFWSSFLYATKIKSTVVEIDDEILIQEANTFAVGLVETNACMERTTQNTLNKKFNTGSAFEAVDGDSNSDLVRSAKAIHQCVNYKLSPVLNEEGYVNGYNFIRPKTDGDCIDEFFSDDIEYVIADYGSEHSCGNVNYNIPNLTNLFLDDEEIAEGSISSLMSNYNVSTKFNEFKSNKRLLIKDVIGDSINAKKEKEIFKLFDKEAEELSKQIVTSIKVDDLTDKKVAAKLMYVKSIFILNKLLGAEEKESKLKLIDTEIRDHGKVLELEPTKYGIEVLNNQAKIIYDYLEKDYCLDNVPNTESSRLTALAFNRIINDNEDFENFNKRRQGVNPFLSFTCLKLLNRKDSYKMEYNALDKESPYINVNTDNFVYFIDKDKEKEVKKYMQTGKRSLVDALTEKYVLQGYIYMVKKAVSMALTEELKKVQDEELLKKIRKEGFAGAGSMMLKITMEQSNATTFKNSIQSTGKAAGNSDSNDGTYLNVVEDNAVDDNNTNGKSSMPRFDKINLISTSNYTRNLTNYEQINQSNENSEKDAFDSFMGNIENMIAYPLVYIKNASGFEQNLTIAKNLENCRNTDKVCVSPDSHPLNALMLFGQETLNYALMIKLTQFIVKIIAVSTSSGDSKEGGVMKKVFGNFPIVKTINIIAGAILIFLDIISPFVDLMMFMGIFLGYVLPTIPYVAFAIAFLSWIISIFTTMISLSIYILLCSSSTGENNIEISKIWEMTGNIILKPALITIAIIFGWTLSSVSLYYVNSTIYALFSTAQDGMLLALIKSIMVYLIYVSIIYIVVYHSFKVINKLPDEILAMLNIRGTQDGQFIESLQFERFIQAKVVSDGINNVSNTLNQRVDLKNARNDVKNYAAGKAELDNRLKPTSPEPTELDPSKKEEGKEEEGKKEEGKKEEGKKEEGKKE